MFRVWGRIIKENHLVQDHVACIDDPTMHRTQKVYAALDELCYTFDLSKPVWLKSNQEDFIRHARTRFTRDNFIDSIDFDYLDFYVIEEDHA